MEMNVEKMEEDVKQVEKSCNNCANYNSCDPSKCFNLIKGTRSNWKLKEDKHNCDKCIKDDVYIMSDEYESKETCSSFVPKQIDERFICDLCKHKYRCSYYGLAKLFIEQNPNNDMKCERYTKE